MLRIIPCLDIRGGRVVKGVNFVDIADAGDPVEAAKAYNDGGADELVFLDIDASRENRTTMIETVRRVAEQISIPLTVGGGITDEKVVSDLLAAGASRVSVNTPAVRDSSLITRLVNAFGRERVTVAIDAAKTGATASGFEILINGGRDAMGIDAVDWAKKVCELGCGEILLTSKDADGTKNGFDIPMLKAVSDAVSIPVVASGGAGKLEDFAAAATEGGASALLAASLFHFGELTVKQVKEYLRDQGLSVKL